MVTLSSIYTKTGDNGETGLGDGARVAKNHDRIHAIGDVDELNAVLGLYLQAPSALEPELFRKIQNDLFDLGADLCVPLPAKPPSEPQLRITENQVAALERSIDRLNARLKPLTSFILPGGTPAAAWAHLARTVCRRAERSVVTLMHHEPLNPQVIVYLNRLSDLLFVACRTANQDGAGDVLWRPGG